MLDRMQFSGTWRDYQARVLEEMGDHLTDNRLHVVAAPGAGKTILGLEIVRQMGNPALVFAPSLAIRDQWRDRLKPLFMDALPGESEVSRSLADPKMLTLSTYQSLDSFRRADELDALIAALNAKGPFTLVLDEAHHLRRSWWECLIRLANELEGVTILALTATPPYDASYAEWSRYIELCGPIDLEIGIPELVRNGDLCPHQDHIILSEPTRDAMELMEARRRAVSALQEDLRADETLLDWLAAHPWLADPDAHIEEVLAAPEMLSATLILLASTGRELPRPALELLGVGKDELPMPSQFWLETLLNGLIFRHRTTFPLDPDRRKALEKRLHGEGLIKGKKVKLGHTRSVFRLLASSLAKMDSIAQIARTEAEAMGEHLRLVVLSDHIRAGDLPSSPDAAFNPAKIGVVPIFEHLRRQGIAPGKLALLTGSLALIPRGAAELAKDAGLACKPISACPDHVEISAPSGNSAPVTRFITALFQRGEVHILVGTQSLLGQGWDAPALNSLILASNTASFVLSNQMRGRAIRIDPKTPDKVSNIWHLATIDTASHGLVDELAARFNWSKLDDDEAASQSDFGIVARRFRSFECIANGHSRLIESGVGRLGLDPGLTLEDQNERTIALAADRTGIHAKWQSSLGEGTPRSQVRETAAPNYAPRKLSWADTLHAMSYTAIASGATAGAWQLAEALSFGVAATATAVGAGITLATIPRLSKAALLAWRNGSVESSVGEVGQAVFCALHDACMIPDAEFDAAEFEIRTTLDGRKDVTIINVSRATERMVLEAIAEALGPIQNPRYLLVRKSRIGRKGRADYHAVPTALAARKSDAESFAHQWQERIGNSELVFTRSTDGRKALLRARMRSFAAGFQRSVDRRSTWV